MSTRTRVAWFVACLTLAVSILPAGTSFGAVPASPLWVKTYDGAGEDDAAHTTILSPDGTIVYGVGTTYTKGDTSVLVVARDASDGSRLWVRRLRGPDDRPFHQYDAALSSDGERLFIVGESGGTATWSVLAVDTVDGDLAWSDMAEEGIARAVGVSPSGRRVYVAGIAGIADGDIRTRAYAAASGRRLWARRFAGSGDGRDWATDLAVSPDGATVFVGGVAFRKLGARDVAVLAYGSGAGDRRWASFYDGPGPEGGAHRGYDYLSALAVTPDGSTVFGIGATTDEGTGYSDFLTLALDTSDGDRRWVRRYDAGGGEDETSAAVSDDSRVYVMGLSFAAAGTGTTHYDAATIAYDVATGDLAWLDRYDRAGMYDNASGGALSPDGATLYVSSVGSGDGTGLDIRLLAYAVADGTRAFLARFDGKGHGRDWGSVGCVSPDGSTVYIGGTTKGRTTHMDALALAYST